MLLMNGYLRKAQHDENNLNIEVTVEVISDFKVKKASVFNGFKRQTTKSTASRLPVARLSSASADLFARLPKMPPEWAAFCLRSFGPHRRWGGADAPYKRFARRAKPWRRRNSLPPSILIHRAPGPALPGWVRKKCGLKAARRAPQFSKR